jgi:GTP-binding protein HflX
MKDLKKLLTGLKMSFDITQNNKERALLVFIRFRDFKFREDAPVFQKTVSEENIEELKNLAKSAGAEVVFEVAHIQDKPHPKYYISTGKLEEIKQAVTDEEIDMVIFDEELTPGQQGHLQEELKIKVIDRTALILDIFAQRAQSKEGKLQVELAQLNYLLPRLRGKGIILSRLGGGIGTRGPGETKLEADRRKIRQKINLLEKKISQISVQREVQRKLRENSGVYKISLVGYTNSGKSTLLNSLTDSDVLEQDMLFSTLDSTTRKLDLDLGIEISLSDTVGFIEKLPHQLIAAFKSTLEEVIKADLLLLVIDLSNSDFENHISSVKKVLNEIEAKDKNILLVFNKIDKIEKDLLIKSSKLIYKNAVFISAKKRSGFEFLLDRIREIISLNYVTFSVKIPYTDISFESSIYKNCKIIEKKYLEDYIYLTASCDNKSYMKISSLISESHKSVKIKKTKSKQNP